MYKLILLVLVGITELSYGQYVSSVTIPDASTSVIKDSTDASYNIAESITSEDLYKHLSIIASDEYEGRETGTKGNEMAATYIANHFKTLGLPPIGAKGNYYQEVAFNRTQWKENSVAINNKDYRHLWDYLSFASMTEDMTFFPEEVLFLGYGIDDPKYSDYKGKNVEGKVIMINNGEPYNQDSISYVTGAKTPSAWSENPNRKLELANAKGAKLVLIIENDIKKFLGENRKFLMSPGLELGDGQSLNPYASHMYISTTMAKEIIGNNAKKIKKWRKKNTKKGKSKKVKLKPELKITLDRDIDVLSGYNVLGYLEGSDKKEELVVVSAHYDHLGKRGQDIFNGADDNGSGTSTVLELAQAMVKAKAEGNGPRRSILFLLVTGEEKGLLGSEYYSEFPLFPLENTVANVNIDMVGRSDKKYANDPNYIYVIGSDRLSTDLHKINEEQNQKYSQITLDYKYNDAKDPNRYYFRSDHYNFAKKGIPAIFFFSGVHEDYHRTSDTVEKIQFDKMEKVGKHFLHVIWELANREERIVVDGLLKDD